jgi:hypothetical protein
MRSLALFSIAFATRLAASVTGTVVTTDGSPLPQVKVEAFRPSSYLKTFQEGVREPLASAITDKDGKFSLNVSGAGVIAIRVQPDGYIPALLLAAADEPAGAIGLHRASIVEGKVTANGKGVGGAKVWLIRSEGSSVVVSTNADGLYRVADPRMWAQAIVVLHPDFAPAMHPANALNFSLDAGREVRGTVVDPAGRAVPGAAVNIDHTLFAKSDAAGKFTFPHVAREAMIVSASTEWAAGFTRLAGGEPKVTLHPIARVTGVIRDAEKHPLSGIAVAVASETVPDLAITDANGAFSLTVPPGKYQLFVEESGAGYFALPVSVDATAGDARQDIVARKQGMIEVKVRGEEGKPVAGAFLSFFFGVGPDTSAPLPTGRITGIDGSVRVPMLPGEERNGIRLVAIKPGLPPATSAPIGESSRGKSVTITIPNGTSVGGMVLDKDKKPISGVRVDPILEGTVPGELPEAANPSDAWATTDSDGRFSGRLSTTTGGLAFIKKGYMRVQQPIQVREGMPPIEAQLATASSISGRVVNKDGSPASEVTLQAGRRTTITAADGSFLLDEVEPGPQAIRFGRTSPQQQTVTAPARDVVLVLPPTRSVRGRVIDAVTSTPVQKFTVAVEGPANDFAFPIPAESDGGDFKIDVPEGPAKLTVTAPGFIAAKSVAVDPSVTDPRA